MKNCKVCSEIVTGLYLTEKNSKKEKLISEIGESLESISKKYNAPLRNVIGNMLNMVPKEKMDKVQQDLNKVNKTSEDTMKENDGDLQEVLTSGQSFSERDRIRRNNDLQEASASKSNNYRRPIGPFKSYDFLREALLERLKQETTNQVNWSSWAKGLFKVTLKGKQVSNGGTNPLRVRQNTNGHKPHQW